MRQQRTDNARGGLQSPNVRVGFDLMWLISDVTGNDVTISFPLVAGALVLKDTPQFLLVETNENPTSATLAGSDLVLTFTTTPPTDFMLEIQPFEPNFRTSTGGYIAAGMFHWMTGSAVVPITVWGGGFVAAEGVNVTEAPGGAIVELPAGLPAATIIQVVNMTGGLPGDLDVQWPLGTTLDTLGPGTPGAYVFNGTNWTIA